MNGILKRIGIAILVTCLLVLTLPDKVSAQARSAFEVDVVVYGGTGVAPDGTGDNKVQAYNFRMCLCQGEDHFEPGQDAFLEIDSRGTDGVVIADAVLFVPVRE